jgi:hypothetical protein
MSGLNVNFHKSEAVVLNAYEETQYRSAFMPVDDFKLPIAAFDPLKATKKVDPWKGHNSSSGGRGILIESCLSSLPMYAMSFYLLQDKIHHEFDKIDK